MHAILLLLGRGIFMLGLARWTIRLQPSRIRHVLYHAVEDVDPPYHRDLQLSISPHTLDCQLDYFRQYYQLERTIGHDGAHLPAKLRISFDDGYGSVYHNAWPILQKHQASCTVFLVTSAVQQKLLWFNALNWSLHEHETTARQILSLYLPAPLPDTARGCVIEVQEHSSPDTIKKIHDKLTATLPFDESHQLYLTSAQINVMRDNGINFGFHSVDHYNLINCSANELAAQLDTSALYSQLSEHSLAYPYGYYNEKVLEYAVSQGFDPVMCTGIGNGRHHPVHKDRVEIYHSDPATIFAQLEVAEPLLAVFRRWMRRKTGRRPADD